MMNQKNSVDLDKEELISAVEKAAYEGARKANIRSRILTSVPIILVLVLLVLFVLPKYVKQLSPVNPAPLDDNNAITLDDGGPLGHTVAEFAEAVLGDSRQLKKIEVFEQELSDAVTIVDTGLFNWGIFTKQKIIIYTGVVKYTVDLSLLNESSFSLDDEKKTVTIHIPHAEQESINIPEEKIKFGDTEKGLLALGDIKLTPEQNAEIKIGAKEMMQEKLNSDNIARTADKFAILSVWDMYSPIIKSVAGDYSLEVEFK